MSITPKSLTFPYALLWKHNLHAGPHNDLHHLQHDYWSILLQQQLANNTDKTDIEKICLVII